MASLQAFSDESLQALLSYLADQKSFVFLESTRVTPENHLSYLFQDPVDRLVCTLEDDPEVFLRRAQSMLERGFFLAGYLGYEFGYRLEPILAKSFFLNQSKNKAAGPLPLADLGVFQAPFIYDHLTRRFLTERGPWPNTSKCKPETTFRLENLRLNLKRQEYLEAIHRIKSYIRAGDTYQVNYTLKLLFDFSGSVSEFYRSLRRNQSVSYGGMIKSGELVVLTFSPELFFRKQGNFITVRPMKGTMRRGRTVIEDREFADFLHNDIKNRSENVMIVDLLRNDLGRLSRMGGVNVQSLFDVETYETLHQMTSSIRGEVNKKMLLTEMFRALFPCGSVTGAPKIRTMEIISELEVENRGVYTGAIGFMSPEGEAVFNVPIRTVVLQGNKGEMGIGSGIVWDSDPEGEWEECKLKGRFLTQPAPQFNLIETMLWQPQRGYWLLDLHLERLAESAHYFAYPVDPEEIKEKLSGLAENFLKDAPVHNRRVRLTLSREGKVELTHTDLQDKILPRVDPEAIMRQQDINKPRRAVFSGRSTDSNSPYLFHKTTLRKIYDEERASLVDRQGYYEVLFTNERGEITEGSYTNIFVENQGKLFTPPVTCGLLPGVLRKYLLRKYPELVVEKVLIREDLEQAEAIYVGNSVRGLVKVEIENVK